MPPLRSLYWATGDGGNGRPAKVIAFDEGGGPEQLRFQIRDPHLLCYRPSVTAGSVVIFYATGLGPTAPKGLPFSAGAEIRRVAPGLFNAWGLVRVQRGAQTFEPVSVSVEVAQGTSSSGPLEPIDLGPEGDDVYLLFFGTGLRGRTSLSGVEVKIGGVSVPIMYTQAQGQFAGLDQVNLKLPRSLRGLGIVPVELTTVLAAGLRWTRWFRSGIRCERSRLVRTGQIGEARLGTPARAPLDDTLGQLPNCYGSTAVMLRFGTSPTGMRVTSFIDLISTTETEFDAALAT